MAAEAEAKMFGAQTPTGRDDSGEDTFLTGLMAGKK